jgi:cytochrome P450
VGLTKLVTITREADIEHTGIGFNSENAVLSSVAEVITHGLGGAKVALTIDGKAVREVPGPKGLPFIGNYFEVYPDHVGNHQRLFDKYGPIIKTTNMGSVVYQTNDPTIAAIAFNETDFFTKDIIEGHPLHPIKNTEAGIFVSDTDTEEWRISHKFLSPALGPKAVRHYAPLMQKAIEDAFNVFDELDSRGEAWNAWPYMLKLSSTIIGKLVLGIDFNHFSSVDAPLHEIIKLIAMSLELNKMISSVGKWYGKMPFGYPKLLKDCRIRIFEIVNAAIEEDASKGIQDLELQEAALEAENMIDYVLRATDNKGNKMPKDRLIEPLVVTIAAGFTTTSSLLAWLLYGLVTYPGMQTRLLQELIDNGFTADTQVTAELIAKLPFLSDYVKETLRRHSPSFQPARTARVDLVLPGGYKLPKDAIVVGATFHIHNNPQVWDNPSHFLPERWQDAEAAKKRPANSYVPFASGQRMCIGNSFVLQAVKVFIPKLLYRYEFSLAKEEPVEYEPYFQLIRPTNLYLRAERRVKWPPRTDA